MKNHGLEWLMLNPVTCLEKLLLKHCANKLVDTQDLQSVRQNAQCDLITSAVKIWKASCILVNWQWIQRQQRSLSTSVHFLKIV